METESCKTAGCGGQLQSQHMESSSLSARLFPPGMKIQSHFMWLHLDCSLSCRLCGSLFPRPMCCLSWSPLLKQKRRHRLVWLEVCSLTSLTRSISPVGLFSCHLSPPLSVWWEPFTTCVVVACTFSLSPSTVYSFGPFLSLANRGTDKF